MKKFAIAIALALSLASVPVVAADAKAPGLNSNEVAGIVLGSILLNLATGGASGIAQAFHALWTVAGGYAGLKVVEKAESK